RMALSAIRTNKLRSILTMLGVTIGVFSVIGVMTALSVIAQSIEGGLSLLGNNTFQFAKYPVMSSGDNEELSRNRRDINLAEANEFVRLMSGDTAAIALKIFDGGKTASYGRTTLQGRTVVGTNEHFVTANSYTIAYGRNLTAEDVALGRPVAIVGADVPKKLFPSESALLKTILVNHRPYQIVGVMDEKGSSFGQSQDNLIAVPITKFLSDFGHTNRTINI